VAIGPVPPVDIVPTTFNLDQSPNTMRIDVLAQLLQSDQIFS